jgi:hypothetical protein
MLLRVCPDRRVLMGFASPSSRIGRGAGSRSVGNLPTNTLRGRILKMAKAAMGERVAVLAALAAFK